MNNNLEKKVKLKKTKESKGITVIALVVTIVLLIIIATISINLVLKSDLITRTQMSQKEFENQELESKNRILGLLEKREETQMQTGSLEINNILTSYKKSKMNLKFVYQIDGTLNGETVYSDIASFEYDNPGKKSIVLEDIPVGADVTIRAVYIPPLYNCNSKQEQNVVIQEDSIANVEFKDSYTK